MNDTIDTAAAEAEMAAALAGIEAYWTELRGGHRLPRRAAVDPARLGQALPCAFMMQRIAPTVGRIRVAGAAVGDLLGHEPKGLPLSTLFTPSDHDVLAAYLKRLFDDPAVLALPLVSLRGLRRKGLTGRLLLLPLIGDDGLASAALGAVVVEGRAGRAPRRFAIDPCRRIRCDRVDFPGQRRNTDPMREPARHAAQPGPDPAPVPPSRRAGTGPGLRLVVDNTR